MKNKSQDPKLYFGLAGLTLAGGIGFLFFQNKSLGSMRSKVAQLSEQAREQKQLHLKLTDTQKSLDDLKTKLAHLEEGVPEAAYLPTMLKELEVAGKQHNIQVNGVRPMTVKGPTYGKTTDPDADKPYQPLDIELKGKGLYSDLVSFVTALNTFPKIVAVRTISVAPPIMGPKEADKRLDVTLGLRAFVFKQSAGGDASASAAPAAGKVPAAGSAPQGPQGPGISVGVGSGPAAAKATALHAAPTSGIPFGARVATGSTTTPVAHGVTVPPAGVPKGTAGPAITPHSPGVGAAPSMRTAAPATGAMSTKTPGGRP